MTGAALFAVHFGVEVREGRRDFGPERADGGDDDSNECGDEAVLDSSRTAFVVLELFQRHGTLPAIEDITGW